MPETLVIQEAITGSEQISDLRDPLHALGEFYRALNTRDLALMEGNWDNGNDAAMDNPLGGIKRGWPEIRAVYESLFRLDGDGEFHFEFYDYTLHRFQEIFPGKLKAHSRILSTQRLNYADVLPGFSQPFHYFCDNEQYDKSFDDSKGKHVYRTQPLNICEPPTKDFPHH